MTTKNLTARLELFPDFGWLVFCDEVLLEDDECILLHAVEDEFGPDEPEAARNITPERMGEILAAGAVRLEASSDIPPTRWWIIDPGRSEPELSSFTLVAV